jgi:hypothetical protein
MVKKIKNEASNLASSRASPRSEKIKFKSGADAQQEFVRQLRELFGGLVNLEVEPNITITTDKETNAFSDFAKHLEKKINKKKLN